LPDNLKIEPLGKHHDRAAFSCGKESLDQYLKNQAGQAAEKNLAAVFVLTPDEKKIVGYYTLSSYTVRLDEIPSEIAKKLTRMEEVPATLLGRLARSIDVRGHGMGEILLVDALKRALQNSTHVASWAVIVDAKDNEAAEFYKRYGFIQLPNKPNRLFLPMNSIQKMFTQETATEATPPLPTRLETETGIVGPGSRTKSFVCFGENTILSSSSISTQMKTLRR
jgi:predicted GNAT family N-acyltransferase